MKHSIALYFVAFCVIFSITKANITAAEIAAPNGAKPIPGVTTSWVGNTYGGMRDGKEAFVMHDIAAIHVTPDGTVYTNVLWEEGGANCSMFRDGEFVASARHTHGWGRNGGKAVCANSKYVFIGCSGNNEGGGLKDPDTFPPKGFQWYGLSRRLRSDFTKAAPFEDGKGRPGSGDTLDYDFLVVNEVPIEGKANDDMHNRCSVAGMVADEERLYVSNPLKNVIEVYDAETMKKITEWDVSKYHMTHLGQMQMDKDGNIWCYCIIPEDHINFSHLMKFNHAGEVLSHIPVEIDFHEKIEYPFCIGKDNTLCLVIQNTLVVTPLEYIEIDKKYYEDESLTPEDKGIAFEQEKSAIYERGKSGILGFFASFRESFVPHRPFPWGEFADLRFLGKINALGMDAAGNIIIAQDLGSGGGGNVLESYRLTGKWQREKSFQDEEFTLLDAKLNWRLFGLTFIDCATLDPDDETMIYTKEEIFKADWSKGQGGEATFLGLTHGDRDADFRFKIGHSAGAWVRNVKGHKLLYVNDMDDRLLQIYLLPKDSEAKGPDAKPRLVALFANTYKEFNRRTGVEIPDRPNDDTAMIYYGENNVIYPADAKPEPAAQGWWVDADANLWRVTETQGIRLYPVKFKENGEPTYDFNGVRTFPHPAEFTHVKRIRYDAATDTLYLGGCTAEHKNQHWKPMGPVVCRYDNFLKGDNPGTTVGKLRWQTVLPYAVGSKGHFSFEPMGFDIAGEYMFLPYTGETRDPDYRYGHVEVIRLSDASSVGYMEPDPATVGVIGLQDIRESLSAHRLKSGEYVIFVEDDYKAKVLMYRLRLE